LRCSLSTLRNTSKRPAKIPALEGSYLPQERIVLALRLLLEGNSLRSTQRITDIDINTLMKILVLAGEKCEKVMARLIVNVLVKDVQADEIWSFIQKKEKQCGPDDDPNHGDAYCFTAIERHSKLILNFALAARVNDFETLRDGV
jgi:hypothetical protein